MMKQISVFSCLILILATPSMVAAETGAWRFAFGYSYLSDVKEIRDSYRHLSKDAGDGGDIYNNFISLSFQPYYQFQNGIRAGAGIGPLILLLGDAYHVQVPVNLSLGYSFLNDRMISPYFRTGISYHTASGDFYSDSSPGFFGAMGISIFNTKPIHMGFEAAFDAAEVKLHRASGQAKHEKIKSGEVTLFVYADF